jgi:hypothetical protein
MLAVLDWIVKQFGTTGLDAMVTFSGGRMGGCDSDDPEFTSSFAPAMFASEAANMIDVHPSSMLVLLEGARMLNKELPHNFVLLKLWNAEVLPNGWLIDALDKVATDAPEAVEFAWIASAPNQAKPFR